VQYFLKKGHAPILTKINFNQLFKNSDSMINKNEQRTSLKNPLLWIIFILYIFILTYAITHHELWGDEIHSWNIAKASTGFSDLIYNTRYEGHPPGWYTILWSISKFTHNVNYIKAPQLIIACLVVFIVLFFSSFPLSIRILIPFGYYFLFEYAVLSRNYAIGVLLAFCICLIIRKDFPYKFLLYYTLLFLLSNTHLFAAILAGSLHLYFLLLNIEQKKKVRTIALHVLPGIIVLLPSVYFIFPPSDSDKNILSWVTRLDLINQFRIIIQAPIKAFIPIPAWWNYNFWNTEFLLEAQGKYPLLKLLSASVLLGIFVIIFLTLRRNKKCFILFVINMILTFIAGVVFPIKETRYVGFIYIGFLAACWLYYYETPLSRKTKWTINTLLLIQLIAGVFTVSKDIRLPFSSLYRVNELLKEVPVNEKIVTDYWCLNTVSAFTDKPSYCIELNKEMSFVLLNDELATTLMKPGRYYNGVKNLFEQEKLQSIYMVSIQSPENISKLDPLLTKSFKINLIDKREGAIEKGSNLYLYQINSF
jgi:hypothetical protein